MNGTEDQDISFFMKQTNPYLCIYGNRCAERNYKMSCVHWESGSFRRVVSPWVVSPLFLGWVVSPLLGGSFRPWVVSPVSRFALGRFAPIYYDPYGHTDRQTGWREGG